MEPTFRECLLQGLQQLVQLSRGTFTASFEKQNNPDDFRAYMDTAFSEEKIKQELLHPNSIFYFVQQDGDTVGYLKLNVNDAQTEFRETNGMELERVYLIPQAQGKGIGAKIIAFVLVVAKTRHKHYVWLGVWEKNIRAIRFYERLGFERCGTHPFYIGTDKQTDWLYKKTLI